MRINLSGYMTTSGYGNCTTQILKALTLEGIEVALFPLEGVVDVEDNMLPFVQAGIHNSLDFDPSAPTLKIAEQQFMREWPGSGRRHGMSFFELDRFSPEERESLNHADALFAPSHWAKSIIEKDSHLSSKPVAVTPMGVDRDTFGSKTHTTPRFGVNDAVTTFINVGKFEKRKGHDFLCTAFNMAFSPGDSVQMVMVCHNPFIGEGNNQWRRSFAATRMGSAFVWKNRLPSQEKLAMLLMEADAGFFPFRSEGWNLDLLECLSVGLPVIATNYSAPTEYLSGENARLIEIDGLEDANDGVFFGGGRGNWASLGKRQLEQAVAHLRDIHRRKQLGRLEANRAGIEAAKTFSWQNTARKIIEGMQL